MGLVRIRKQRHSAVTINRRDAGACIIRTERARQRNASLAHRDPQCSRARGGELQSDRRRRTDKRQRSSHDRLRRRGALQAMSVAASQRAGGPSGRSKKSLESAAILSFGLASRGEDRITLLPYNGFQAGPRAEREARGNWPRTFPLRYASHEATDDASIGAMTRKDIKSVLLKGSAVSTRGRICSARATALKRPDIGPCTSKRRAIRWDFGASLRGANSVAEAFHANARRLRRSNYRWFSDGRLNVSYNI